jgi:uncharacterized metal-binding protein
MSIPDSEKGDELDCLEGNCARCPVVDKICRKEEGKGPEWCPTLGGDRILQAALQEYKEHGIAEFAREASRQEAECYAHRDTIRPYVMIPVKSRVEELVEFSRRMGYKKLGLAFCSGLMYEAALLSDVLEKQGFSVVGVACKVGGIPKETLGVKDDEKINIGKFEPMCNPITQARFLDASGTDFNIMLGLCIGHDSLFLRHIKGLTTVFAVKDRVTGHNPMAALYTSRSYYQRVTKLRIGEPAEGAKKDRTKRR